MGEGVTTQTPPHLYSNHRRMEMYKTIETLRMLLARLLKLRLAGVVNRKFTLACVFLPMSIPNSLADPTLGETMEYISMKAGSLQWCSMLRTIEDEIEKIQHYWRKGSSVVPNSDHTILFGQVKNEYEVVGYRLGKLFYEDKKTVVQDFSVELSRLATRIDTNTIYFSSFEKEGWEVGGQIPYVTLHCTSPGCIEISECLSRSGRDPDCVKTKRTRRNSNTLDLYCLRDSDRMSKALKHAIKLSGGKDELF